ncbi:MAG: hypothetical protein JWO14_3175 [Solirubrobacterales bacterium]|nr:hypothetical protein [Solirubrobacterales bacterium]
MTSVTRKESTARLSAIPIDVELGEGEGIVALGADHQLLVRHRDRFFGFGTISALPSQVHNRRGLAARIWCPMGA